MKRLYNVQRNGHKLQRTSSKFTLKFSSSFEFRKSHPKSMVGSLRMRVTHNGENVKFSVPGLHNISVNDWNFDRNCPQMGSSDAERIFRVLNEMKKKLDNAVIELQDNVYIHDGKLLYKASHNPYSTQESLHWVREFIVEPNAVFSTNESMHKKFCAYIEEYFAEHERNGTPRKHQTINQYKVTAARIDEFENKYGNITYKMLAKSSKDDILKRFGDFLTEEKKYQINSKAKLLKQFNSFLEYIDEKNILSFKLKRFDSKGIEYTANTSIALTEDELQKLKEIKGLSPRLDSVRKMFLIACYTAIRYSDWKEIARYKKRDKVLLISVEKTNDKLGIPIKEEIRSFLDEFVDNGFPNFALNRNYNAKFNVWLKEVAKLAGLDRVIMTFEGSMPLYSVISSHVARSTFISREKSNGTDDRIIQTITGHKTEKSYKRYLKVSQEDLIKEMNKVVPKNLAKVSSQAESAKKTSITLNTDYVGQAQPVQRIDQFISLIMPQS
jgi:site-specific recombinase XerD